MKSKWICISLSVVFFAMTLMPITGNGLVLQASRVYSTVDIYLDNERVVFTTQEPVIINNRVLVPLELIKMMNLGVMQLRYNDPEAVYIFEMMGLDVSVISEDSYAIMIYDDWTNIVFLDNEQFMVVDSLVVYLDVMHQIINGQRMLPLRAIMEALLWGGDMPNPNYINEIREVMLAAGENLPWWDPTDRSVHIGSYNIGWTPAFVTPRWEPSIIVGDPLETFHTIQERFPTSSPDADTPPQYGGSIRVGIPSNVNASGSLNAIFSTFSVDMDFMRWFGGNTSVFSQTPYRTMGQSGIVTWDYCVDNRFLHLVQTADVYWHDGHPLTLNDLVFAHEMIAHPDYLDAGGTRWNTAQQNIIGAWEYHRGEADYISGLVLSEDERELTIYFVEFPPTILHFGFFTSPYPRHIFGDVPLFEQQWHYHSTESPVGWGPFIVEGHAPGDSLYLVANENYWQGRPNLDSAIVMVLPWDFIPELMLDGFIDISSMGTYGYTLVPEADNFYYLALVDNFFGSINFNLGYWCDETSRVVPFDTPRMNDPRLRRAMAFAIDESVITSEFYSGLRIPATSILPPFFSGFYDPDLLGFYYDPDRANAYLDEAGFLLGPDGWRKDPDGNEFIIHFVANTSPDLDFISDHYARSWEAVGLQVYVDRREFFDMINEFIHSAGVRDFDVGIFFWSAGLDPNPSTLWGHSMNNVPRFMSDEFQLMLDGFNSQEAWDTDWLRDHFHAWQRLFYEHAPAFPANWRVNLTAVNNRVMGFDVSGVHEDGIGARWGLHRIWVTRDEAYIGW